MLAEGLGWPSGRQRATHEQHETNRPVRKLRDRALPREAHTLLAPPSRRAARPSYSQAPRSIMIKAREELQNPQSWLSRLAQESDGYARLIGESGGLARAAYRLARARCKVASLPSESPTLEDLQAAARLLAARIGRGGALPITSLLASDADSASFHAVHATLEGALRSRPPPPLSQQRAGSRAASRKAEAGSRPSAPHH